MYFSCSGYHELSAVLLATVTFEAFFPFSSISLQNSVERKFGDHVMERNLILGRRISQQIWWNPLWSTLDNQKWPLEHPRAPFGAQNALDWAKGTQASSCRPRGSIRAEAKPKRNNLRSFEKTVLVSLNLTNSSFDQFGVKPIDLKDYQPISYLFRD